ncbi:MAG: adenylate kinase [Bryobacteraceae bacterium]
MARLCIILFGPPGSGKGTQAKLLRSCMSGAHISTGDMLRERVASGDELGSKVADLMASGQLVPDELVNRLVEDRIELPDSANGFILDGYPRTVPQAEILTGMLEGKGIGPMVVHLKVDYNKIIARLSGRRQCPQCGSLYSLASNAPNIAEVCDYCGSQLVIREDDREDVIRGRLDAYDRQTKPVLEFFRQSGVECQDVDGNDGSPQAISQRICGLIQERRMAAGK